MRLFLLSPRYQPSSVRTLSCSSAALRICVWTSVLSFALVTEARADWTEVTGAPGMRKFVDLETVRRTGSVVRVAELMDFQRWLPFSGVHVLSIRWVNDYDCVNRQTRVVSYEAFGEPMGRGVFKIAGAESVDWAPVPAGSLASNVWELLCRP